jgi:short-subunit dehydrogenase
MKYKLRKLRDQVIVITGASSGIGLVTARMAARRGARLVLAARSEDSLRHITDELSDQGCEAIHVAADVSREEDHRRIYDAAMNRFSGFDTWINNAAVSVYGRLLDVSVGDHRRLFDINFWGVVYGSRTACELLRRRGGALINVGSTVSDRAIPLQGMYSASKHAVKAFTDALRMELEEEGVPISVSLIKPGSINTPYPDHAKNYLGEKLTLPPPVYAPDLVAEAILHCAEHPERELFVGSGGAMISAMGRYAPRIADKYMERTLFDQQRSHQPDRGRHDGLYQPTEDPRERGDYEGMTRETSMYTQASMHPVVSGALLVAAGLAAAQLVRSGGRRRETAERLPTEEYYDPGM